LLRGVKQQEHEADHSPPSSVEVKKTLRNRDSFTLFFLLHRLKKITNMNLAKGPCNLNAALTQVCNRHFTAECQLALTNFIVDAQRIALRTSFCVLCDQIIACIFHLFVCPSICAIVHHLNSFILFLFYTVKL
jgi:hypothetical protein